MIFSVLTDYDFHYFPQHLRSFSIEFYVQKVFYGIFDESLDERTYIRVFADFFKLFLARWRLVHSFFQISVAQIQNFSSNRPKITLRRAQNKKQRPNAADRPNLAVLKPSKAEPLQPYLWSNLSKTLDLSQWYLQKTMYQSPF